MLSMRTVITTLIIVGLLATTMLTFDVDIRLNDAWAEPNEGLGEGWSPTEPSPAFDVYYPGTERLEPDEMRVIACGTGMPMPRLKQAAACFLIELGNGSN